MEAVKAVVFSSLDSLVDVLEKKSDDCDTSQDTRTGSESLLQAVLSFNFLVLLYLWHEIWENKLNTKKIPGSNYELC